MKPLMQVPEEARELDKELKQITKQKNEAVRSQDFEKVIDNGLISVREKKAMDELLWHHLHVIGAYLLL
jgi:hypothetical protein